PTARPETLFGELTGGCRVFPFLYVKHGDRVLLGALGGGPGNPVGGVSSGSDERRSVMATVQGSLEGIEVFQEPVNNFRTVVDHRYDRMLPTGARR
ncbi:MAG TPA: hypothetical protein VIZ68_03095, partial [Thermoplasmata archaeon]